MTRNCRRTVRRAQENLLRLQSPEGYWVGELMVDSTLCSDYVLYMHWRGKVDPVLQEKCVRHIRKRQLPDGGWNIYHGGPSEINACVKAYFALKLAGHSPQAPWMCEARATILRLGGIPRCNTFSKLYLALMGVFPWKYLPTIPAELVLLPDWLYFNIYQMSSWTRAMMMPLAIINHFKPTRTPPRGQATPRVVPVRAGGRRFLAAALGPVLHLAQLLPAVRRRRSSGSTASAGGPCAPARCGKPRRGWSSAWARVRTASRPSSRRCSTR